MADAVRVARGAYKPRRPQASPLFRLVQDHLHRPQTVYEERFADEYDPGRPVVAQVADKFLAGGVLDHGFARIRCDDCAHEYLLAFSCKCRDFCPSCHAKRLASLTQWLDTTLLAPVPHRQVALTIPKRLRAYCSYRRRLLGEFARVAARTVTTAIRTLNGERDWAVGMVACLPTHGARANWRPPLHRLVDGTFGSGPMHETARLTEAFRHAVLRLFVRLDLFDQDPAARMLTWPHSGFHVHTGGVPEDDRSVATRRARYGARNPSSTRAPATPGTSPHTSTTPIEFPVPHFLTEVAEERDEFTENGDKRVRHSRRAIQRDPRIAIAARLFQLTSYLGDERFQFDFIRRPDVDRKENGPFLVSAAEQPTIWRWFGTHAMQPGVGLWPTRGLRHDDEFTARVCRTCVGTFQDRLRG